MKFIIKGRTKMASRREGINLKQEGKGKGKGKKEEGRTSGL